MDFHPDYLLLRQSVSAVPGGVCEAGADGGGGGVCGGGRAGLVGLGEGEGWEGEGERGGWGLEVLETVGEGVMGEVGWDGIERLEWVD